MPPDPGLLADLESNAGCGVLVAACVFLVLVGVQILSGGLPGVDLARDGGLAGLTWVAWTLAGTLVDRLRRGVRP